MTTLVGKTLRQSATIRATPSAVYATLVDPKKHAKFSGAGARLVAKPGGPFAHYDGQLAGYVMYLEKNRRIVLAWRAGSWSKGDYSIAEFLLTKVRGGTRIDFVQYGIPAAHYADIADGWRQYYWAALKNYLE